MCLSDYSKVIKHGVQIKIFYIRTTAGVFRCFSCRGGLGTEIKMERKLMNQYGWPINTNGRKAYLSKLRHTGDIFDGNVSD